MIRSSLIRLVILIAVLVAAVWVATSIGEYETLRMLVAQWGYPALFLIAVISGFSLIAPVPAVAFVPLVVAAGLNFWIALLIVVVGMTVGDGFGIFLGHTGRGVVDEWVEVRWLQRVERLITRWKIKPEFLAFLYAAFVPLPNELLLVPLSFLGRRPLPLLGAAFAGNAIFNGIAAALLLGIVSLV